MRLKFNCGHSILSVGPWSERDRSRHRQQSQNGSKQQQSNEIVMCVLNMEFTMACCSIYHIHMDWTKSNRFSVLLRMPRSRCRRSLDGRLSIGLQTETRDDIWMRAPASTHLSERRQEKNKRAYDNGGGGTGWPAHHLNLEYPVDYHKWLISKYAVWVWSPLPFEKKKTIKNAGLKQKTKKKREGIFNSLSIIFRTWNDKNDIDGMEKKWFSVLLCLYHYLICLKTYFSFFSVFFALPSISIRNKAFSYTWTFA